MNKLTKALALVLVPCALFACRGSPKEEIRQRAERITAEAKQSQVEIAKVSPLLIEDIEVCDQVLEDLDRIAARFDLVLPDEVIETLKEDSLRISKVRGDLHVVQSSLDSVNDRQKVIQNNAQIVVPLTNKVKDVVPWYKRTWVWGLIFSVTVSAVVWFCRRFGTAVVLGAVTGLPGLVAGLFRRRTP